LASLYNLKVRQDLRRPDGSLLKKKKLIDTLEKWECHNLSIGPPARSILVPDTKESGWLWGRLAGTKHKGDQWK